MQKNYFLKTVFTFLLCGLFSMSNAADWYISSTGNDTSGDGLTVGTAWASFSKAQTAAADGDVIYVSGMIDFTLDPANTATNTGTTTGNLAGIVISKNITLQGTSPQTDGFQGTNGSNTTRFFQITNAARTLTLKNIKLANGVAQSTTLAGGGGAITMSNGNIVAENIAFDGNSATGYNAITGGAIYIGGTNTLGTTFKNCVFSNNWADKAGAINVNKWAAGTTSAPSIIQFENCSFIGNEARVATGGSAISLRTDSEYSTCNFINCTFTKNKVLHTGTGGTINLGAKGMRFMNVNIINCTITENTTAGVATQSAGVYFLNQTNQNIGNLYIKNSIIEGNTAAGGAYSDLGVGAASPTVPETGSGGTPAPATPGYIKIENSIIGAHTTDNTRVPAGNVISSQLGYLTTTSTTNDLKAGLAPFNAITNSYSLYASSAAIGYGNSVLLTPYSTTDQLGNVRTVGAANTAGAIESTPLATITPSAPTALVATAGDGQISVAFKSAATGGAMLTNYKYSLNDGAFVACDPAVTAGPIVITGLTNNTEYTVKLIAVNANGESAESVASNAVTPAGTTGLSNELNTPIKVYKNSNNQIVVNNASLKTGTITLCNALGQRVVTTTLNGASTTINKSLKSGVYVVLVSVDGKTNSTKIIL